MGHHEKVEGHSEIFYSDCAVSMSLEIIIFDGQRTISY